MQFELISKDENSNARQGIIKTSHGDVETPLFIPVATSATVKTMDKSDLEELGAKALISNAFLLYLRPGKEVIEGAGGLHNFMNWPNVLFTDSGGFQMIRRDFLKSVSQDGIKFQSPFDGLLHEFTPEKNMEVQLSLGADILMVQDDCPPAGAAREDVIASMDRTVNWASRCKQYFDDHAERTKHGLFGIVQGGIHQDLRGICIGKLRSLDFDGYAVGGLSIGEAKKDMYDTLKYTTPKLPEEKVRYLMGVGSPEDILQSIEIGIDVFDSVFPTRNARHSTIYTSAGRINLSRRPFRSDFNPLDLDCDCFTCRNHTKAYVNHLLRQKEPLGIRLTTMHNLHFLLKLVSEAKAAISENDYQSFKNQFVDNYVK